MRLLLCIAGVLPMSLRAHVPTIQARVETTPIPAGFSDTDDAAVWVHPKNPEKSLILGTSKFDENSRGGLGVYSLDGRELQFFPGSKLNSVDVLGDLAVATNRSENALDTYRITRGKVSFVARTPLVDEKGQPLEPYGLCLMPGSNDKVQIYLPTKSGVLYQYALNTENKAKFKSSIDLTRWVTPDQDAFIKSVVTKETIAEGETDELEENLAERFILEGCAVDLKTERLYVGMENLGIWSLNTKKSQPQPKLVIPVQGSWTDIDAWQAKDKPRVTDDIEGLDIVHAKGRTWLLFSSQGISEFTLFDLKDLKWLGNFKVVLDADDPITKTDGLAVKSGNFGAKYPQGVLVVHDDENTTANGTLDPANYKVISLEDLWRRFPNALD